MKFSNLTILPVLCMGMAAPAFAAPVILSKPHLASYVRQITPLDGGKLCIVGQSMDPDGDLQSRGTISMVDAAHGRLLWQKVVKAPAGNAAMRFVACRVAGEAIYVAANVDTHSEQSLNQSLVYLYRFDSEGKVIASQQLVTGSTNALVYGIEADANGVRAAGIATGVKAERASNAIFFATLDRDLKNMQVSKIEKGAYAADAVTRLDGGVLLAAGNFAPASAAVDAFSNDYAISKIVAGKYQFSVRPQQAKADDVASAISAAGEIVSLGVIGKQSTLSLVGADGKLRDSRQLDSSYCHTGSISADAGTVYAVRSPCGRSQDPSRLVAIARKSGAETIVKGIVGEPVHVLASGSEVLVIARKSDGILSLQTLPASAPNQ